MEAIWTTETEIRKREFLPGDMESEAVVIGAGLTGILTAYYLQQAGISTIVLEADRIGNRQMKNMTVGITSQHGMVYDRLIGTCGSRTAFVYGWANEDAIREYEKLITEKKIACDFARCSFCLYSRTDEKILRREAAAAKSLDLMASLEKESELPFTTAAVLRFERQARFVPFKFLAAVAEEVTVYEKTKVLDVEETQVKTDRGCVRAKYIIFTAHDLLCNASGFYGARMYQEQCCMIAVNGAERLAEMYQGIDQDRLFLCSQKDLLLLGGGSQRGGTMKQARRYEELRSRARGYYPTCHEAACWQVQDYMTLDELPYIGRFADNRPDWYVAAGFGKWGAAFAMISARVLTALITRQKCPEAAIFSSKRRFPARAVGKLLTQNVRRAKKLFCENI